MEEGLCGVIPVPVGDNVEGRRVSLCSDDGVVACFIIGDFPAWEGLDTKSSSSSSSSSVCVPRLEVCFFGDGDKVFPIVLLLYWY